MSEQQPQQDAFARNSKLIKYDYNRPQRQQYEMIRISGPGSHKKGEKGNVEVVLNNLPAFPMGKFSWTSEELDVPDNPTDDDKDIMLVIGEILPSQVVTRQAEVDPNGVIPCVGSARPLVTPVRGSHRNLFALTTRDSTSQKFQVQIYGSKDNWDYIFFYPEYVIKVETNQYRARFTAWTKNITKFLIQSDRGQLTNAIPLASKGVKPPPSTTFRGHNDHYVVSKCIKALCLYKITRDKSWFGMAAEAASGKAGYRGTKLFDELGHIDELFHGQQAFSLQSAKEASVACRAVWFDQAPEEDVKVFNPEHLLKLADCLRAEQPVLLDTDILPPLYRTLLVVFCTLAEDGRQDWSAMLTMAYNCARWSAKTHDRDRHMLTSGISAVKDPQTALLSYLRNEIDFTGTLIREIEDILEHDDRELQSRIKPRWLNETADPSPSAALERLADASDPEEANLAAHELALTYMMRGHLLARRLIATLKAKKSWDQQAIEGLVSHPQTATGHDVEDN
ncbi:hypothetical protein N0V85_008653 [Neurospora sp. IMI 360204]|nr:hypothetical protein N0V85_008653 [Neurospora sp. IMI 360204]